MGLRIQNNVEAFNTHRQLSATSAAASKSMEKLSSGYRINRAADDAAGLAISEKMRGQIGGLAQAQRNAQDGISLVQTAEGALGEVHSMLQRVRDLRVQFGNDTLSTDDQAAIRSEASALARRSSRSATRRSSTGTTCSTASPATLNFQVGANDGEVVSGHHRQHLGRRRHDRDRHRRATYAGDAAFTALTLARRRQRDQGDLDEPLASSARSRTASSTVWPTWRPTRRTWWRPRVADPRRGHGQGDDELHEAQHPAAGRHEHARAGQPGAAEHPLAAPSVIERAPIWTGGRWPPVVVKASVACGRSLR